MSAFNLDAFIREATDVVAQGTDQRLMLDHVSDLLRRLLGGPVFLDDGLTRPSKDTINAHVLHRDEKNNLVFVACAWAAQQGTPIHDHGGWGIIGGLTNRVIVTNYRRLDDHETPGFADVAETSRMLVSETSFAYIRPPEETIHKIENPFREPAVTLHVFADNAPWAHMFDPPAKTVTALEESDATTGV